MMKTLLREDKFDSVVRKIVRDIITIYKTGKTGEFGLPEDVDSELHFYEFSQLETPLQIFLEIEHDDSVEGFDVDADYYRDDDLIYITIISNPRYDSSIIYSLIGELNEVVRHEIEHVKQYESDNLPNKREPKNPEKYYTQKHEVGAQKAGFKRASKVKKMDYETLVRNWFEDNKNKHKMNPDQVERVIQKILQEK